MVAQCGQDLPLGEHPRQHSTLGSRRHSPAEVRQRNEAANHPRHIRPPLAHADPTPPPTHPPASRKRRPLPAPAPATSLPVWIASTSPSPTAAPKKPNSAFTGLTEATFSMKTHRNCIHQSTNPSSGVPTASNH